MKKGRKFTPLGYVIFIGGILLSLVVFFVFNVWKGWMDFFLHFSGTFGMGMNFWGGLGLAAWAFPTMLVPLILAILLGSKEKE
jgi:hypothetical protein